MSALAIATVVGSLAMSETRATWRDLAPATRPTPPRSGHTAAHDPKTGRVWLFGGYAEAGADRWAVNDLYSLGPGGPAWELVEKGTPEEDRSRPQPCLCSAAAVLNGELLLFGGWNPQTPGTGGVIVDDVFARRVDGDGHWERLQEGMPGGPASRHVACVVGEELLVHTHRCAASVLRWDRAGRRLVEQPTRGRAPSSRGLHVAAAADGETLVVFGGADKSGSMVNDVFALSTKDWTWRELSPGPGPCPRAGACAAPAGPGKVAVFGGARPAPGGAGLEPLGDLWVLHLDGSGGARWEEVFPTGDLPPPRNAATLTATDEGLVLHGGWRPFVSTHDDTRLLTLE